MTQRYLRSRNNGAIFEWNPILAENPACEELTAEQALPEQHIPRKQRGRKSKLALEVPEAELEPEREDTALDQEATIRTKT